MCDESRQSQKRASFDFVHHRIDRLLENIVFRRRQIDQVAVVRKTDGISDLFTNAPKPLGFFRADRFADPTVVVFLQTFESPNIQGFCRALRLSTYRPRCSCARQVLRLGEPPQEAGRFFLCESHPDFGILKIFRLCLIYHYEQYVHTRLCVWRL